MKARGMREAAAALAAVVGLLVCTGTASAAGKAVEDEYERRLASRAEMVYAGGEGPDSVVRHLETYNLPLEYVAQFHPMPEKRHVGPTLRDKAVVARAAVEEVGRVVDRMRAQVTPGDKPNEYVVEQADKTLDSLVKGYNSLTPTVRELDRVEKDMKVVAGILFVIAPSNKSNAAKAANKAAKEAAQAKAAQSNQVANQAASSAQDDAARRAAEEAARKAAEEAARKAAEQSAEDNKLAQQDAVSEEKRQREARVAAAALDPLSVLSGSQVIHPKTKATGEEIEKQADSELGLMTVAVSRLRDAQASARKVGTSMGGVGEALAEAEAVTAALAGKDGQYRAGMKGSSSDAKGTEVALRAAIDAVGAYAEEAANVGARMSSLMDGRFGYAVDAVLRCSQENKRMSQVLQGEGVFQVKSDAISRALAKNLAAVRSIEAMSPDFHVLLESKGGSLVALGKLEARSHVDFEAPEAKKSADVTGGKAVRSTVVGGEKLIRDAGSRQE